MSQNRYYSSSALSTTLASAITTVTATTFTVSASPASLNWPTQFPYTVLLDWGTSSAEAVSVTGASGTTLTCTRGIDGTLAQTHSITTYNNVFHGLTGQDVGETQVHMVSSGPSVYQPLGGVQVTAPVGTITGNSPKVSIPSDTVGVHGIQSGSAVVGTTDTQTLTNKTMTGTSNTLVNVTAPVTYSSNNVGVSTATTSAVGVVQLDGTNGDITTSAVGDTAAAGSLGKAADAGHKHGREAFGAVTGQATYGLSSGNGSATTISHSDHTHGTPSLNSTAGNIAALAASASAGAVGTASDAGHVHPNTGLVTSVTGTAPIISSGGQTPAISVSTATTSATGVVQLDGTASDLNLAALTAAAGSTGKAADAGHAHPIQWIAPTGALVEWLPRALVASNNVGAPSSGALYLEAVLLTAGQVFANLSFCTGTVAASIPTHWWFCILDSTFTLRATTADQTTTAMAASTLFTKALTSSYTVPSSGLYYVGRMVAATTPPSWTGVMNGQNIYSLSPALHGSSTTGLTTPGTVGTTTYANPNAGTNSGSAYGYLS